MLLTEISLKNIRDDVVEAKETSVEICAYEARHMQAGFV
jgi:hypothetical protein